MRLLNLDLDDLYLRGRYEKEKRGKNEVFVINLGNRDNLCSLDISNEIYIRDKHVMTWPGVCENIMLWYDRYMVDSNGNVTSIVDVKKSCMSSYNILFTGLYSLDCKNIVGSMLIGGSANNLKKINVLAYGVLPNLQGVLTANLVLMIPVLCDYKIGDYVYSGRTGKMRQGESKLVNWMTVTDILINYVNKVKTA